MDYKQVDRVASGYRTKDACALPYIDFLLGFSALRGMVLGHLHQYQTVREVTTARVKKTEMAGARMFQCPRGIAKLPT